MNGARNVWENGSRATAGLAANRPPGLQACERLKCEHKGGLGWFMVTFVSH